MPNKRGRKPKNTATKTAKRSKNSIQSSKGMNLDVVFAFFLILSILLCVTVYTKTGYLNESISPIISGIFGPIKYLLPIGSFFLTYIILKENKKEYFNIVLKFFLAFSFLSSVFAISQISGGALGEASLENWGAVCQSAYTHGAQGLAGGGFIGAFIALPIVTLCGPFAATVIMLILTIFMFLTALEISPSMFAKNAIENLEQERAERKKLMAMQREMDNERYVSNSQVSQLKYNPQDGMLQQNYTGKKKRRFGIL